MTTIRDYETMLLRETGIFIISIRLFERLDSLFIPHIRDSFIIQKRRDVVFKTVLSYRTTQNITSFV